MKKFTKTLGMAAVMLAVFLCMAATALANEPKVTLVKNAGELGDATFDNLPVGIYDVIVSMDGYYSKQTTATIEAIEGQNHAEINVELEEITEGNVTVTIKDSGDTLLQGVDVTINGITETTNAYGVAVLSGVPIGTHEITAYKDGYYTATGSATLVAIEGQDNTSAEITLTAITKGSISLGEIKNDEGNPLGDVIIKVNGQDDLDNLPEGTYAVEISKDGYYTESVEKTISFVEGQESYVIDITLRKITEGTATVYIIDTDGIAVITTTVTINGIGITTDENGKAIFTNLPVGDYEISAYKAGYYTNTGNISVVAVDGQDNPTTTITLTKITTGSIKVIVKNKDGNPIAGATVNIQEQ